MASRVQVLLVVCFLLQFVECVFKTKPGENQNSKFEIIVPHNASIGYLVTKLGCSDSNINIQTHGRNEEFHDLFVVTNSGMLLVRKDLSKDIGKSYIFTVSIPKSCKSNIPAHSTYVLQILHSINVCHFPQRFYTGFLPKHALPGIKVKGIYDLSVLENKICKEVKLDYKIMGKLSEHFGLNSASASALNSSPMSLVSELPQLEYGVLYFTVIGLNGQNVISHTNVEIMMIDDNDYNRLYKESPRPLDKSEPVSKVSSYSLKDKDQSPDKFIHEFDQNKLNPFGNDIPSFVPGMQVFSDVRHNLKRIRRQAPSFEIQRVHENKTGVLFSIPGVTVSGNTFEILDADSIFQINSRGEVSLKPGNKLDYESDPNTRNKNITVKTTGSNGETRTSTIQVVVQDVNDEIPVFKNRPMPMLAAVSGLVAPNFEVYRLLANDTDASSDIRFFLKVPSDDFSLDDKSGSIKTKRNLNNNQEYILQVVARDINADGIQESKIETVSILTGLRPPQFYYNHYYGTAMENTRTDTSHRTFDLRGSDNSPVSAIQVKNFQTGQITFKILEPPVDIESNKLDITSAGIIVSKVSNVWNYETRKTFDFIIAASDSESLYTSKVNLTINILDVNEFVPQFLNATYKATVSESIAVGSTVLEVQATDADADQVLTYNVTDDHFRAITIGNKGYIVVNRHLDYDRPLTLRYNFKVTATDNGTIPLFGEAIVEIKLENVNDEPPIFDADANKEAIIRENMPRDDTVIIAKAVDIYEGDIVTHTFADGALTHDIFTIERSSGKITLNTSPINRDKPDQYILVVYAVDDGSCCGSKTSQTASTTVTINIVDAVNTKPVFENCNSIGKVSEEQEKGTQVIQIRATDNNRGENGNVEYFLRTDQSQATSSNFTINKTDGWITTKVKIDREALNPTYTFVSIMAQDRGQPPANNYCTLKIEIEDINDNPPLIIGAPSITGYFEDTAPPETLIMRIQANDKDAGPDNNDIEYSLVDNPGGYMKINPSSGDIRVQVTPPSDVPNNEIRLTVMAQDKGTPRLNSTAEVILTKQTDTSGSPEWIGTTTFSVEESVDRPYTIATLRANPGVAGTFVDYNLLNSSLLPVSYVPPFTVEKPGDGISIVLKDYLDYETKTSHNVILRATNRQNKKYTIVTVTINVLDTNDEYPRLTNVGVNGYIEASVPENKQPGEEVRPMYAVDRDITPPFNKVSYYIQGNNSDFRIDSTSGMITTNSQFDREAQKEYFVTVLVKDGAKSAYTDEPNESTETVRIEIEDENDNSPYFKESIYNASVPEDKPRYYQIILVEAQDPDDDASLKYSLEQNGQPVSRPFDIKTNKGSIFVSYDLDFETEPNVYDLTVSVYDGKYTNMTKVIITVTDVNDEEPVFNQDLYVITNVSEADEYSPVNKLLLVQVSATDPDTNRKEPIEYYLDENQNNAGFINKFEIEKFSGKLYLKGQLDRDQPNGRDVYQFDVKAIDDGPASPNRLTAYATIKIYPIDVNDNSPIFDVETLTGYVKENSAAGTPVMTIVANDYDAGNNAKISYQIGQQKPSDAFAINLSTGSVTTTTSQIDREQISNYTFEVIATDGGVPPRATTATATVIIKDVNDNPVTITPDRYSLSIPESHTQLVKVFEGTDPDIDDTLFYEIVRGGENHFTMTSRGRKGELSVVNRPDYDAGDTFFSLLCEVDDGREDHKATFHVNITILDVNDEIPEFTEKNVRISVHENIAPGTPVKTFTATDRDAGANGEIEYFISHKEDSDPDFHFEIGINNGQVRIRQSLDRETKAQYQLKILAIDKGIDIRNTGTATMTVEINDVNDEFPKFRDNYKVEVRENTEPSANNPLVDIYAVDTDTIPKVQKFGFELECGGNICDKFSLIPNYSGDGGKGTATVNMKVQFDYEEEQFYYLPIRMWDTRDEPGQGQTGTNTLTVSIINVNDNPLKGGGSQVIRVYNYKGMFQNLVIGRVNYDDPDGWDIDNNLQFTMSQVEPAMSYFSVDSKNGDVKMLENVPSVLHAPFEVIVKDSRSSFISTVTVNITDLPEEAPFFSGSMRLSDTTPEDFVAPGKGDLNQVEPGSYDKFRRKLAELLNDGNIVDNVQIISVLKSPDNDNDVDVRFSAHGSPYYKASQLEGIVSKNKNEFQTAAGIKISTVSINACLKENCEGGCYNELDVTGEANVINAPGASVVGVKTLLHGKCGCRLPSNTTDCTPDYCYNGGTCEKNYWGVLSCKCPSDKFDGPRCQQTRHGFDGRAGGYAIYKTLEQCEDSITSIEIITNDPNGLIYYNGPSAVPQSTDPTDLILLQLENGQPKLMVDHGSGMLTMSIPVNLNDGRWHQIDVQRQGKQVTMTIDHCKNVANVEGGVQDRSACEARGFTPGENVFINVKSPLEMGGRYVSSSYPPGGTSAVFNGCVRNLRHNNEIYDLFTNGAFPGSIDGCPAEDDVCRRNSIDDVRCEPNGDCRITQLSSANPPQHQYICICDPGFRGVNCETNTTIMDFRNTSYLSWDLVNALGTNRDLEIQLNFRSRDNEGLLYHVSSSTSEAEFITIQIKDYMLELSYNLGDGIHNLTMYGVNASDGYWHMAKVQRFGKQFIMTMDGGEGVHFVQTGGPMFGHQQLDVKQNQLYSGAGLSFLHNTVEVTGNDLTMSCFNDIRLQSTIWFPMTTMESSVNKEVKISRQNQLLTGCVRNDCANSPCFDPFVCRPLWGDYDCVCKPHYRREGVGCVPKPYCNPNPCLHGTCMFNDKTSKGFNCTCVDGWEGDLCNMFKQTRQEDTVMAAGLIAMLVILPLILIILLIALVFWLLSRKKDDNLIPDDEKEDYDIRENIVSYDDEGAGEEDNEGYDINRLRKPINGPGDMGYVERPGYGVENEKPLRSGPPGSGIGDFIDDRLNNADDDPNAPPFDTLRDFDYEGGGSEAGSLSSLNTSSSGGDQDYDYLNDWGPKFAKLADMYNQYDDTE